MAACSTVRTARIPLAVKFILQLVRDTVLQSRYSDLKPKVLHRRYIIKTDARADGNAVGIGGFLGVLNELGQMSPTTWFAFELSPEQIPWAHVRGKPFRSIASLELLATLVAVMVLIEPVPVHLRQSAQIELLGITDNQSNAALGGRRMTTKFPLVLTLIELAAQLKRLSLSLNLAWSPREGNQLADDLSNNITGNFNPALRVQVSWESLPFLTLNEFSKVAAEFYAEISKPRPPGGRLPASRQARPLKRKEPW
eukprot:6463288-Amphidinium_carterae.1